MKHSKKTTEDVRKIQSDNYAQRDMFNFNIKGNVTNTRQYVDKIFQQVHVQAPSPEAEIEHLEKSLKTNRQLLNNYKQNLKIIVIEDEYSDKIEFEILMKNIVTVIKNIEVLIRDITFKGGLAEFGEGEIDPARILEKVIKKVNVVKEEIVIKKPCCPYCHNDLIVEDTENKFILSIDKCPKDGFLVYGDCRRKKEINGVEVRNKWS